LLGSAASGCSFAAIPSPPSDPTERTREAANECTASNTFPILDSVGALVGAVQIGIGASMAEGERTSAFDMTSGTAIAVGVTELALFGAGAIYGYTQVARCKTLRREVEQTEGAGRGQ
jgi:hypothetical protein